MSRPYQALAVLLFVLSGFLLAGAVISASGSEGFENDALFEKDAPVLVWVPTAMGGLALLALTITGLVRGRRGPLLWGGAATLLLLAYLAYLAYGHH